MAGKGLITEGIKQLSASFLSYLHLWTWLDQRMRPYLSGRAPHEFSSVEAFWSAVMNESVRPGDRVRFKEGIVTEWFPLKPGLIWYQAYRGEDSQSTTRRINTLRKGERFAAATIMEWSSFMPSVGVVRLSPGHNSQTYAALCLTTVDSWCCDLGVPLGVSDSVYDAFVGHQVKSCVVEATIDGVLRFAQIPLLHPDLLKSIGSQINSDFLEALPIPNPAPQIYVQVTSPLDVRFHFHNSHPPGCVWAINRSTWNAEIECHPIEGSILLHYEERPCEPYYRYQMLTTLAALHDPDDVRSKVRAFKNGSTVPSGKPSKVPYGTPLISSVEVLTECDSRNRDFSAKIPLEAKPWRDRMAEAEIIKTLKDLQNKSTDMKS